jgi:hypothetical protein
MLRIVVVVLAAALAVPALAQNPVRTQTIPAPPKAKQAQPAAPAALPEIVRDPARLPEPVRATRERILAAARSGDPAKVAELMKSMSAMPVFSFGGDNDPLAYWKSSYPDSDGIEVLAILIEVLESPYVVLDPGTAQETYVWPYFAGLPLERLTPEQKVELFRLITGSDWKEMQEFGAYIFYRVGIAPSGQWQFFVAGD